MQMDLWPFSLYSFCKNSKKYIPTNFILSYDKIDSFSFFRIFKKECTY